MTTRLTYGSELFWTLFPDKVQWVAVDPDSSIRGFWTRPAWLHCTWQDDDYGGRGACVLVGCEIAGVPDSPDSLIERPHVWRYPGPDTPIDAPVWWWHAEFAENRWMRAHWAGPGRIFANGHTSWTADGRVWSEFTHAILADADHPDKVPPVPSDTLAAEAAGGES